MEDAQSVRPEKSRVDVPRPGVLALPGEGSRLPKGPGQRRERSEIALLNMKPSVCTLLGGMVSLLVMSRGSCL